MDRWKAEQGRGREKRKIRRKKMQMREKVGKSRNTVFFQWFVAPEGRKVGPLKWRVRSQLARWEMKNCITKHTSFGPLLEVAMSKKCTPLWREAHFEVKMYKAHQVRTTFGSWDVEKVYAVVARSTFWSQNVQSTPGSDHFWKLRCRKSVRRCGAKHILKSKCTKHHMFAPLLEVRMLKKCTPLWREAHFEVKMYKTPHVRATFGGSDVEKVHAVVARSTFWRCTKHTRFGPLLEVEMSKKRTTLWREAHFEVKMYKAPNVRATFGGSDVEKVHAVVARSTFRSQNVQNTTCSRHFWKFGCWKSARRCGAKHILKSKCTKRHMFAPLFKFGCWHFEVKNTPHVRATFGGSDVEKVHAVVARSTSRSQNAQNTAASDHFWKLRCRKSARRCGVKMYKTLGVRTTFGGSDVASLQDTTLQNITLHYTPVHYITLHYTPVRSTTLNYTTPHYITLNDTATQIDR